jgi:hypothetical protein
VLSEGQGDFVELFFFLPPDFFGKVFVPPCSLGPNSHKKAYTDPLLSVMIIILCQTFPDVT